MLSNDFPYYPDSPVGAGGSARTGDLLFATLLVWAGRIHGGSGTAGAADEEYFLLWFCSTRCGARCSDFAIEQANA